MLVEDKFNTWINLQTRKSSREANDTTGIGQQTKIQTTSETSITAKSQREIGNIANNINNYQTENNKRNNIENSAF